MPKQTSMCVFLSLICSESSEYSDWTEEVGLRTQQQTENRRPRRVCRVLSTSEEEGAEPSSATASQPGPSSPQRQSKAKKESKKNKKPTKKKRVRNAVVIHLLCVSRVSTYLSFPGHQLLSLACGILWWMNKSRCVQILRIAIKFYSCRKISTKIPLLTESHIDYHVAFLPKFNCDCRRLSAAL